MATEDIALPDDASLFDAAIADDVPAETPEASTEPVTTDEPATTTEQPRDELGKFAAKTETPAPVVTTPAVEAAKPAAAVVDDDKGGQVPSWRVREINAEKAELAKRAETLAAENANFQRRLAALEKPATAPVAETKPDPLLDPEGYESYLERKFEERAVLRERNLDMQLAHRQHGKVFEEAYSAAQEAMQNGDVQLKALMNSTSSPGETLVKWHRERAAMREVGNDPNAWLEKKLEERMNDPAFLAKAVERARGVATNTPTQPGGRPAISLPPSLSTMTRADNLMAGSDDSEMSDAALFAHATR